MQWRALLLFGAVLLACIVLDVSILIALVIGLALFLNCGRHMGFGPRALLEMCLSGVRTVKGILITFVLIGMMTALWRASGAIPMIVCLGSSMMKPAIFLPMTFLLNALVSVLTGTSFGTSATMGVICATMGAAMGVDPRLTGGAVLSGAFFGDRCSPVSTSALLVAALTKTNIYDNLRRMARTALVPFVLTCIAFLLLGKSASSGDVPDLRAVFARSFNLHPIALVPAAAILLLAVLRVNVKIAMLASIACALPLCLFLQKMPAGALFGLLVNGFRAADAEVGAMLNGGGILSMARVSGIVCLSSAYAGIFQKTGLLSGARHAVEKLAKRTTPYAATLAAAVGTGAIACNQTLSIMLTHQLCDGLEGDDGAFAVNLEDTAVVVAPLFPWSIAGSVPLSAIGAPTGALLYACYLYLVPLCRLIFSYIKKLRRG